MMAHLQAHRRRREHERQLVEQARRSAAYPLIIRAARDPESLTDSEWDTVSDVIDTVNTDHGWVAEKLQRAAECEAAIADVPELLTAKRHAALKPHGIDSDKVNERWSRICLMHSELESISRALPSLVPRPAPLRDPLAV